jgi:hypothetical protein
MGYCEHGNKPSGQIKVWEFLNQLNVNFSRRTLINGVSFCSVLLDYAILFIVQQSLRPVQTQRHYYDYRTQYTKSFSTDCSPNKTKVR